MILTYNSLSVIKIIKQKKRQYYIVLIHHSYIVNIFTTAVDLSKLYIELITAAAFIIL